MNALMKLLAKSRAEGKNIARQIGNIGKGGMDILGETNTIGNGLSRVATATQGGKTDALKKLLLANKGGAATLGAGALGAGGAAAYGAHEMMDDDEPESVEDLMKTLQDRGKNMKKKAMGYM